MLSANRIAGLTLLPVIAISLAWLGAPPAGDAVAIAGVFTMTYSDREILEVPDTPGHELALTRSQGSNRSTGPSDFMSGARITIVEVLDLIEGNGSNRGYVIQSMGEDSVVVRFEGKVTTTVSSQGGPSTSARGNWTFLSGAGQHTGIRGTGTFHVVFTSENEFTVEWEGEYSK